jgi:hypothetical protein
VQVVGALSSFVSTFANRRAEERKQFKELVLKTALTDECPRASRKAIEQIKVSNSRGRPIPMVGVAN